MDVRMRRTQQKAQTHKAKEAHEENSVTLSLKQ